MISENAFEDLKAKVARLERGLELRQYRSVSAAASPLVLLRIIDGGTAYDDGITIKYGIIASGSVLVSVPTAYDPNSVGSTPGLFTATTGIGRAQVITSAGVAAELVLVLLDPTSPIRVSLIEGDEVQSGSTVSIPVGAGPDAITAYLPKFI